MYIREDVSASTWTYRITLHGGVEHEGCITREGGHLLWQVSPVDEEDEDGRTSSCLQEEGDFAAYGPPESPEFLQVPSAVLDGVSEAVGASDASWRKPLPENVQSFFVAASRGDLEAVRECARSGVDIKSKDHHGRTALWYSAEAPTLECCEWLLQGRVDVDARDRYGRTVLMDAVRRNDERRVDLYKANGADLDARDKSGKTAWLTGVDSGTCRSVMLTVRSSSQEDWPRALHLAAWNSNIAWMEGEDWFVELWKPEMNWREGTYDRTPLQASMLSCRHLPQAVRWIAENGADLTVIDKADGSTVLHLAAQRNFAWLVDACVKAGVDVNARNQAGQTALAYALDGNERPRLLKALLAVGANPEMEVSCAIAPRRAQTATLTVREKAQRMGLVWSHWLLEQPDVRLEAWSGFCSYARLEPADVGPHEDNDDEPPRGSIWLEFPMEWCEATDQKLSERLLRIATTLPGLDHAAYAAPILLTQEEALKQPAGWPKRDLWALLPDASAIKVERFRDERPREMMSSPAACREAMLLALQREWSWRGLDWKGQVEKLSLTLRRGALIWKAYNTRVEQSLARFRVEGPPRSDLYYRTMPEDIVDEVCALIGDSQRLWEFPCAPADRKSRLETWLASQPPPLPPLAAPSPPPHPSGKRCYARMDIEDRFHTSSGAGSDGEWSCWMEFPAEWCLCPRPHLEQWLVAGLSRAYEVMNEKASAQPDGGHYTLHRCWAVVLSRFEAVKQPWANQGKVLYSMGEHDMMPHLVPDAERRRPLMAMGDPENPPPPVAVPPSPLTPQ